LVVDDGQTIIIAGLMRETDSELVKKVPFLGDVPVMGLLFRNRGNVAPNQTTELVIMLTPTIIKSANDLKNESLEADRIVDADGTISKYISKARPAFSGIPSGMRSYVAAVQDKISRTLVYPPEAAQYGWEGTVKVNMLILQDGTLAFALVRESSGFEVIDDNALEIAKANAPYSAFPPESQIHELNVTIPIVYSLNGR
jgi:TonB family protein